MPKTALLLCLIFAAAAHAQDAPQPLAHIGDATERTGAAPDAAALQAWRADAAKALAARDDAGALVAASMLAAGARDAATATRALQRAVELAPRDPDIAWIAVWRCADVASCAHARENLHTLEADNAAVWLPDLYAAAQADDAARIVQALQGMAAAKRYDDHQMHLLPRVLDALGLVPPPAGMQEGADAGALRAGEAMALTSVAAIPPLAPLGAACGAAQDAARQALCLRVAERMQQGTSLMAQMVGEGLARRLLRAPQPLAELAARQRVRAWRMQKMAGLMRELARDPALAQAWTVAMRGHAREDDAVAALLAARGIPVEPPAGWQPAVAAQRDP
ncbi:MAG: hypothetical protein ABFC67_05235 [Mizugakiibacter sp.]|uniref:hypothetical protein n=1 Tax=Mizugakiibacter sp. TaxID=1972610 RepID=UPI0031C1CF8F|nr:hypothetical protein [Xanthomonadaceae bacterium]